MFSYNPISTMKTLKKMSEKCGCLSFNFFFFRLNNTLFNLLSININSMFFASLSSLHLLPFFTLRFKWNSEACSFSLVSCCLDRIMRPTESSRFKWHNLDVNKVADSQSLFLSSWKENYSVLSILSSFFWKFIKKCLMEGLKEISNHSLKLFNFFCFYTDEKLIITHLYSVS